MKNAIIYRDELSIAKKDFDKAIAEIRNSTIFAIVGAVLCLNKKGVRISVDFAPDHLTVYKSGDNLGEGDYLKSSDGSYLYTVEQMLDVLEQLEEMDKPRVTETEDDIKLLFEKEDESDAEAV